MSVQSIVDMSVEPCIFSLRALKISLEQQLLARARGTNVDLCTYRPKESTVLLQFLVTASLSLILYLPAIVF